MNAAASESRNDRVLVMREIAAYLRCTEVTVRRMIKRGELTGWFKVGSDYRMRFDILQNWAEGNRDAT
jgi:excisionase family DNA binding protein